MEVFKSVSLAKTNCQVAGWGDLDDDARHIPKVLQWAKVPIRNTTECRTNYFLNFLKGDMKNLTGSVSNSMLTWKNIKKIGHRKSVSSNSETLIYRPIINRMHICAGDTITDTCQVTL